MMSSLTLDFVDTCTMDYNHAAVVCYMYRRYNIMCSGDSVDNSKMETIDYCAVRRELEDLKTSNSNTP